MAQSLMLRLALQEREYIRGLVNAKNATNDFAKKTKTSIGGVQTAFRNLLYGSFGLYALERGFRAIKGVASPFIQAASAAEQYTLRLKVMHGSQAEATRLYKAMSDYASKVPFEFEQVLNAATSLSGVMSTDDVIKWMPMLGDLAATTGFELEHALGQFIRMYSAGAQAADMFRERGILAMLGFKAGVSYTAQETRQQLLDMWNSPLSQFKGATDELRDTWSGTMSMMSDKWFQFRTLLMDTDFFDFAKGTARAVDSALGAVIEGMQIGATRREQEEWLMSQGYAPRTTGAVETDVFTGAPYTEREYSMARYALEKKQREAAARAKIARIMSSGGPIAQRTPTAAEWANIQAKREYDERMARQEKADAAALQFARQLQRNVDLTGAMGGASAPFDLWRTQQYGENFARSQLGFGRDMQTMLDSDQMRTFQFQVGRARDETEQFAVAWTTVGDTISSTLAQAMLHVDGFGEGMKRMLRSLSAEIASRSAIWLLFELMSGGNNPLGGFTQSVFANYGSMETRASGGPVNAGQPYIVGEQGPEVMVPKTAGTILPNGAAGAGKVVTFQVVVADDRDVEEKVLRALDRNGGLAQHLNRILN